MKSLRISFLFAVAIVTGNGLFMTGLANLAEAGIEPSPFTPEINQLGAAVNILDSADRRILKVIANPPDETEPSPNLEGALYRLAAINNQLNSVDDMVQSLADEVMGTEPSPFRLDVLPALEEVRVEALKIVANIQEFTGLEPCPIAAEIVITGTEPSPFIDALTEVQCSAQTIVINTENSISRIEASVDCPSIVLPTLCKPPCLWLPSGDPTNPGYCDYAPDNLF